MNLQRALSLLVPLACTTACLADATDETLAETSTELSAFDWGGSNRVDDSLGGAQVATLNGTTYMVHTGPTDTNMYWRKRVGSAWSAATAIPGQKTRNPVSLAAFNGFLYMMHVEEPNTSAVWFSRFNPATETWTPSAKLPFSTDTGAPALAAFDGRLWIVGAVEFDDTNFQLWVSTMNASETFTDQTNIPRRLSSSHVSLAAYANKLYLAYASVGVLYTLTHNPGAQPTVWSSASTVKAGPSVNGGPSGTASLGYDAQIATAGGYLHLVHRRPHETTTWWTYWNQCNWAPEIQFDTVTSSHSPALSDGGPGLVLIRDQFRMTDAGGARIYEDKSTEYSAPPAPIALPQCKVLVQ